ncbi:MAG: hypothetical protein WCK31_03820 [bacterium]
MLSNFLNIVFGVRTIKPDAVGIDKNNFLIVSERSDKYYEINKSILSSLSGKSLLEYKGKLESTYSNPKTECHIL